MMDGTIPRQVVLDSILTKHKAVNEQAIKQHIAMVFALGTCLYLA